MLQLNPWRFTLSNAARTAARENLVSMLLPTELSTPAGKVRGRSAPAVHSGAKGRLSAERAYSIVKRGVSSRALGPLAEYLGVGKGAVAGYLDLDRATATRKAANNELLPTHAAESLLRLLELNDLAEETFETPEEAAGWLRRRHPMLADEAPLDCAKSSFGAQRVKDILLATKYGGVV